MIRLPYLPLELVAAHILLRLPVETLLRFRCVCKAWRDAVDDASFRRAHLRRQRPCLLISPQIVKTLPGEVTTGGLYLWLWGESQKEEATLVHAMSGPSFLPRAAAGPWEVAAHDLAHCDGLVLVPAYSAVHLLNPATRRAVPLPPSLHRPHVVGRPRAIGHHALGLGLDPRSNAYKVARFSYRSSDKPSGHGRYTIGMEVLTVRIPTQPPHHWHWRETSTPPPYPVMPGRTATFFKGSLFWTIDESLLFQDAPGFMRFRLDDESFGVTPPPPCRRRIDYQATTLSELSGELCLCVPQQFVPDQVDESYELWVCHCHGMDDDEQGGGPRWERRHVIVGYPVFQGLRGLRPMAADADSILLYGGTSRLLCRCHRRTQETTSRFYADVHHLSYHHPDTGTLVEYKNNVCDFNITAYTPSLLPL